MRVTFVQRHTAAPHLPALLPPLGHDAPAVHADDRADDGQRSRSRVCGRPQGEGWLQIPSAVVMQRNDYFASESQLLPQVCLTRGNSAHERGRSSSGRVAHPTGLSGVSGGCTRS